MKRRFIGYAVLLAVTAVLAQSGAGAPETYRELYEQGYYDEAIRLLDSLVLLDSATDREKMYYLAACRIARGDRDKGAVIFEWLLADDSSYKLDTIYTPPKILEVFREVRLRFTPIQTATAVVDLVNGATAHEKTVAVAGSPESHSASAKSGPEVSMPEIAADSAGTGIGADRERLRTALRIPPGLLPCGGGHFLRREPVKGALLCAAQAVSLGVCIWAVRTREGNYDPVHGWYADNRAVYNRYTGYTWAGAGLLLGSYVFGVIDYFYHMRSPRAGK